MIKSSNTEINLETSPYLCPHSHLQLRLQGDHLQSSDGQYTYPIRQGLPVFLQYEPIDSKEVTTQLAQLNGYTKNLGWQEALQRSYGSNLDFLKYITDRSRSKFLELIPLTLSSKVLEIGPGLGQFTGLLAARVNHLYALEVSEGQAQFVAEYCRQIGANNVTVACGGDNCRLPYQDQSFDVIVLNLVFEWCGARVVNETHTEAQLRFLCEMYRVLKPSGALYLATKNRYALKYLLGKVDEHAYQIRFGNALPRGLMHFLLRRQGQTRSAGFLYSYPQLRRMLLNQGFKNIQSFWAAPEVRYPERLIPTDTQSIRQARSAGGFNQGEMRSTRLLMPWIPSAIVKYVTPGLVFLVFK